MLNGDPEARYWGNVNLSFAYVEGESLLMGLKASGLIGFGWRPCCLQADTFAYFFTHAQPGS